MQRTGQDRNRAARRGRLAVGRHRQTAFSATQCRALPRRRAAAAAWFLLMLGSCSQTPTPMLPGVTRHEFSNTDAPDEPQQEVATRAVDPRLAVDKLDAALAGFFDSIGKGWGPGYAPSGLVVVTAAGRTVWSKSLGYAQYEQSLSHSPTTPVLVGPLEHLFTALVALRLVDDGTLSLEAPLGQYLQAAPEPLAAIPLGRFLQYRAGLPRIADAMIASTAGRPVSEQLALAWERMPVPQSEPQRLASNAQRAVLVAAIERVTGEEFSQVLARTVTTPLQLDKTGVLSSANALDVAERYAASPQDGARQLLAPPQSGSLYASAHVFSSASDLLRTVEALRTDELLSEAARTALHQPIDNTAFRVASWTSRHRDFEVIHWGHEGRSAVATRSALWTLPELDLTVAVLSNNQAFDARLVARATLEASLGHAVQPLPAKRAVKLDEQLAERVRGAYFLSDEAKAALTAQGIPPRAIAAMATASIFRNRDKLFFKPARQGAMRMTPSGPEAFVLSGGKATLTFDFDQDNPDETVLMLRQGKVLAEYQRKPARQPKQVEDEATDSQ